MGEADDVIARLQQPVQPTRGLRGEISGDVPHSKLDDAATQVEATPQWVVRFTWDVARGLPLPKYTYAMAPTESKAIDQAVNMIDNYDNSQSFRLVEVHVRGPAHDWAKVE